MCVLRSSYVAVSASEGNRAKVQFNARTCCCDHLQTNYENYIRFGLFQSQTSYSSLKIKIRMMMIVVAVDEFDYNNADEDDCKPGSNIAQIQVV